MKFPKIIYIIWFPLTFLLLCITLLIYTNYNSKKLYTEYKQSNNEFVWSNYIYDKPLTKIYKLQDQDVRISALKEFLHSVSSPLEENSEYIVEQSDVWGLDYALIPAMAMQESQGCKKIPANSYNCWGYGIYGSNSIMFSSYKEAIARIAQTIKESYINGGLTNVTLVEDKWAPPSKGQWSFSVNYFIGKIKEYEKSHLGT
jgi:hypothetical protein